LAWRHFGDTETPDWKEAPAAPEAPWLELSFDAPVNDAERALEFFAQHVDETWTVTLNGKLLGHLRNDGARLLLPVPKGALVDGPDLLLIRPPKVGDDVTFGQMRLLERGYREVVNVRPTIVRVLDRDSGRGMPARLAILAASGGPAWLHYAGEAGFPTRPGIQYTDAEGRALLELPPGRYLVHAQRGTEWGMSSAILEVKAAGAASAPLTLSLAREVDTAGWLACDTHLHTYTHSGHGDATVAERMLTLAGEGLEVAVATDHNHQLDYSPAQSAAGLTGSFLPIVGSEVTTEIGHFNSFPLPAGGARPNHKLTDWPAIVQDIRAKGARVVILNHPRWPNDKESPFDVNGLNAVSGDFATGARLTVDAIEVFNTTEAADRWMRVVEDWFALLNAGVRVTGVASSDSHTVRDPVGQGRTYLMSTTDDPARATEDEICQAFERGASTMSQGLFLEVRVQGEGPGALVPPASGQVQVQLRVAGASWARATRADVFVNGRRVDGVALDEGGKPWSRELEFTVRVPAHDSWIVCLAQGPVPEGDWWFTIQSHLAALSNPVWVDGDGDGRWQSPREVARALREQHGADPAALSAALAGCDAAVRAQAVALQAAAERQ
jgi:predicted metal-dependent phosphoesterase TrpH